MRIAHHNRHLSNGPRLQTHTRCLHYHGVSWICSNGYKFRNLYYSHGGIKNGNQIWVESDDNHTQGKTPPRIRCDAKVVLEANVCYPPVKYVKYYDGRQWDNKSGLNYYRWVNDNIRL